MIPQSLRISGFLSYRDPTELDFTQFSLACISGSNGAGKSSLLDALTWALFGQARKRDDSLVNMQSKAAEVVFVFQYENETYRVQRSLVRGRSATLELQMLLPNDGARPAAEGEIGREDAWKPLTERTLRETQAQIERILRLDYDTFVNAAFFLQGRADQFAQQTSSRRKEVLGNILGMEVWDGLRAQAGGHRHQLEGELESVERRTAEIAEELAQEPARRQRLAELERQLENVSAARVAKAAAVEAMKSTRVAVEQQRTVVKSLDSVLAASRSRLEELARRQSDRTATRDTFARTVDQAAEIETSFKKWSTARVELQRLDQIASKFHQREQERLPLVSAIESEKARLLEEQRQLVARGQQVAAAQHDATSLRPQVDAAREALRHTEQSLQAQTDLQARQAANREELAARNAENEALRSEMDQIRSRLDALQEASGASCPLCGQPLSDEHRTATLNSLEAEGKQRGDRFRLNRSRAQELESDMARIESELAPLDQSAEERSERISALTKLTARMDSLLELQNDWAGTGAKRLEELTVVLSGGTFAQTARTRLAALDAELAKLGYDAAAHDQLRQDEQGLRGAEESHRALREAQAALAPLDKELADLETEVSTLRQEMNGREQEAADARNALAEAEAALPDLARAEKEAIDLREKENSVHQELGAARQRVDVLADLRLRELELGTARDTLALDIARHKRLERAFGKDGVPALLIEQALPEIESRANDLLDRLSDGQMSVHFVTQAGYKNKRREDLRETLDIQISDGAGQRDYELYSGGEAFRINFAIRLALSQVLAARKGARLQTLVIDEGFGSQDARGRQRLIEAINLVKGDFEKILVITHLEELKDAFPARIEIEKTDRGSAVRLN